MRLLQDDRDDSSDDDSSRDTKNETSSVDDNNNYNSIDSDEDDERRSQRSGFVAPRARQCNTQQSDDEVEFECKSITTDSMSDIEDELKFKVRATRGDYLKITVKYETEVETAQSETETETQYTVVYDRLIEYRKAGTAQDDHYEWDVDEVVAEWPLNDWDPLSTIQTTPDNRTIFSATTSTGMVTFTFTIAQSDSDDLATNKMKIDFLLENYPWDASGNTYIALVSRIETEREIETETDDGEDEVSDVLINFKDAVDTIGFVPFGEYSWATTAEATSFTANNTGGMMLDTTGNATNVMIERSATITNGQNQTATISVVASKSSSTVGTSADSTLEEIAFSFVGAGQGANRIFWDPEAGVGYASSASKKIVGSFLLMLSSISMGLMLWL